MDSLFFTQCLLSFLYLNLMIPWGGTKCNLRFSLTPRSNCFPGSPVKVTKFDFKFSWKKKKKLLKLTSDAVNKPYSGLWIPRLWAVIDYGKALMPIQTKVLLMLVGILVQVKQAWCTSSFNKTTQFLLFYVQSHCFTKNKCSSLQKNNKNSTYPLIPTSGALTLKSPS